MTTTGEPELGALQLVGTPLGNLGDLSARATETLRNCDVILAEDTRVSTVLLRAIGAWPKSVVPLQGPRAARTEQILTWISEGKKVALVSDAGMPGVSDPGTKIVREVVAAGLAVTVIPGPSALSSAIALAHFDASHVCFFGFLSSKSAKRRASIEEIKELGIPFVIFEAPHRIQGCVEDLRLILGDDTEVALARELTKKFEEVFHGTLGALSRHLGEKTARGEYTLIVNRALVDEAPAFGSTLAKALREKLLKANMGAKDAADIIALVTQSSRSSAYEFYLSKADELGSGT